MAQSENFHFEIIRRNQAYPTHYSFIKDWLKSVNNEELQIKAVNSLNSKLKIFYGIPKLVNHKWIEEFGPKLVEDLCTAWELPDLTQAPIPWRSDEILNKKLSDKRVGIVAANKFSKSDKKIYSQINQLQAFHQNGVRLFFAIYPGCTIKDIRKLNWNRLIKKAYRNPKTKGKISWKRDILLWDLVKTQNSKATSNKKFFDHLKNTHLEFKSIQPSSIERQFSRTAFKIASYPLKLNT